ncbi:MAG: hypothetical protein FOGNACKC_01414 [Anaerolineae bacterium]|nr:hypothetical protein [Anaerolineae bacterium]
MTDLRSLTPHLPTYPVARHFLRIMDGVAYSLYRNTFNMIMEQRGSPKDQVDWTKPDEWISARLTGEEQALAWRLWNESDLEFNPRYLRGPWYLTTKHNLLAQTGDILHITDRGEQFLSDQTGPIVAEIDAYEGLLTLLKVVAERSPGKHSDFLPDYAVFCRTHTKYQSDTPIKHSQYERLVNLIDRNHVVRSGQTYEVTDTGLAYLDKYATLVPGGAEGSGSKQSDLRKLAKSMSDQARSQLMDYLATMDPFKFEALIKFLLEEMGYTDVEVTAPSNDKGIDVVANIQLGISSVREVVQAKRHKGNINRTVLDQLRGSLHRFNAVRGTIITTGGFSKGTLDAAFERAAAPITLIDGPKLLKLLEENSIGLTKKSIEYVEFDNDKLAQFEPTEDPDTPVDTGV